MPNKSERLHLFLLLSLVVFFILSFINCYDPLIWFLEALFVIIFVPVLVLTYSRFKFTNLAYVLIWIHAIILLIGAHYTYPRVPLFNWAKDTFELSRNYYDRLGHFAQGFIPAILAREVLLRKSPLKKGRWLFAIVVSFCLAISAAYELFEWIVSVVLEDKGVSFLATQGDPWDAQKDMFMCLMASVVALLALGKLHDRALGSIGC